MRNGAQLLLMAVLIFCLGACSSTPDMVDVREYHLKSTGRMSRDNPIIRAEQQKRLRGAVSYSEQQDRLGQYYSVDWSRLSSGADPVRVEFHYQQAATGHKKLVKVYELKAGDTRSSCEFIFNGEEYKKKGRVLCWRVEVHQGAEMLGSEQSYLWR